MHNSQNGVVVDAAHPAGNAYLLAYGNPSDTCLRCQADLVRYRRLRQELAGWRHDMMAPPPGLLEDLAVDLDELDLHRSWPPRRRAAYLGGIAAATAAGVGGVIVLAARSRRLAG